MTMSAVGMGLFLPSAGPISLKLRPSSFTSPTIGFLAGGAVTPLSYPIPRVFPAQLPDWIVHERYSPQTHHQEETSPQGTADIGQRMLKLPGLSTTRCRTQRACSRSRPARKGSTQAIARSPGLVVPALDDVTAITRRPEPQTTTHAIVMTVASRCRTLLVDMAVARRSAAARPRAPAGRARTSCRRQVTASPSHAFRVPLAGDRRESLPRRAET